MIKIPALHLPLRDWLLEGSLSAQVPAYVARLKRGDYASHTCERNLNALAHFAHWMTMCHLPAHMLDEGCIDHFLRYHLPCCDCLGVLSTEHVLNVLARLNATPVPESIQSSLHLNELPVANTGRYDSLRTDVLMEVNHAS